MGGLLFWSAVIMAVLKLADVIDVSWLIVFAPIWVPFVASLVFEFFLMILIASFLLLKQAYSVFQSFFKNKLNQVK